MNFFEEKYDATRFAEQVQMTKDNVRDWRRRGIQLGQSAAVNGHQSYSDYDVLETNVINYLRYEFFDDLRTAFEFARHITPRIARLCGLPVDGIRYVTYATDGRFCFADYRGNVWFSDDPTGSLENASGIALKVIDTVRLTEALLPFIKKQFAAYMQSA